MTPALLYVDVRLAEAVGVGGEHGQLVFGPQAVGVARCQERGEGFCAPLGLLEAQPLELHFRQGRELRGREAGKKKEEPGRPRAPESPHIRHLLARQGGS